MFDLKPWKSLLLVWDILCMQETRVNGEKVLGNTVRPILQWQHPRFGDELLGISVGLFLHVEG